MIIPTNAMFSVLLDELKGLQGYAVQFRYPGRTATKEDAREAVKMVKGVRKFMRGQFGLPE
jgi:hypothetical protein